MEEVFEGLEASSQKLFEALKFQEVEQMVDTFLKELQQSVQDPKNANLSSRAVTLRARAKYLQVRFPAALADCNQALNHDESNAKALFLRGTIEYRMGNFDQALKDLNSALTLDQHNKEYEEGLRACQREMLEAQK